jgi:LAGLIDADG endonuclease
MKSFLNYLDCGIISEHNQIVIFKVSKFSDIDNKIIPFFIKYPIIGIKYKDFLDFCKVKEFMKNKEHLTLNGLEEIKEIKSLMNTGSKIGKTNNSNIKSDFINKNLTNSIIKIQKRNFHSSTKDINKIGPINNDILSIIFGSLLGDGYAERRIQGKGT